MKPRHYEVDNVSGYNNPIFAVVRIGVNGGRTVLAVYNDKTAADHLVRTFNDLTEKEI